MSRRGEGLVKSSIFPTYPFCSAIKSDWTWVHISYSSSVSPDNPHQNKYIWEKHEQTSWNSSALVMLTTPSKTLLKTDAARGKSMLTFELLYSHVSRSHRPDCHTRLFLKQNVQPISLLMYHVSQVNTAFDDLFCRRLKLISRLGSQLWFVNIKIKNPRTGKYFIEQTVKPAVTGLLKTFLCRYVYPVCKWKSPLLLMFFTVRRKSSSLR